MIIMLYMSHLAAINEDRINKIELFVRTLHERANQLFCHLPYTFKNLILAINTSYMGKDSNIIIIAFL